MLLTSRTEVRQESWTGGRENQGSLPLTFLNSSYLQVCVCVLMNGIYFFKSSFRFTENLSSKYRVSIYSLSLTPQLPYC